MYVFILPISGGGFVSQLGILEHLCDGGIEPNVMLASSGGNVASYVACASNWKWAGIERVASNLSRENFCKPWSPLSPLSILIGYFKGDVYNKGDGVKQILMENFSEETIKKYEIWTGIYNKNKQKSRLVCNRSKEESILNISCIDFELTQSMDPIYANGDINLISECIMASASIPAIVPSRTIENDEYIDGGMACASPLAIMQEPILKYCKEKNERLHMIYINCLDLSVTNLNPVNNVLDKWKQATFDLIRSQTVFDRLTAYEILRNFEGKLIKAEFKCNYDNLKKIKNIQNTIIASLLEIYPTKLFDVDLFKFTGEDIVNNIHLAYNNCRCRVWIITNDNNHSNIKKLISNLI